MFVPNTSLTESLHEPSALASDQQFNGFEQELEHPLERQPQRPRDSAIGRDNVVPRILGECLLLPAADANYKAPVLVLSGEVPTVYSVIEKHFSQEVLSGKEEKFWRTIKAENSLETWRPRIQGQQLRALQNVRLPDTPDEYERVRTAVSGLQQYLKPGSTVEAFMEELQQLVGMVETWWENRNKRDKSNDGAWRSQACLMPDAADAERAGARAACLLLLVLARLQHAAR